MKNWKLRKLLVNCSYRPQSSGLDERFNATSQKMLSLLVNESRNNWDDHLPYVLMAYRATTHDNTHYPNLSMTGREMNLPTDVMTGSSNMSSCPIQYVEWVKSAINKAIELANSQSKKAAIRQKKYFDRGLNPRDFESGDMVWRWYPPRANLKLGLGWIGPYMIWENLSDVTYKIQKSPESDNFVVHVDHLKPYQGVSCENWLANETDLVPDSDVSFALNETGAEAGGTTHC